MKVNLFEMAYKIEFALVLIIVFSVLAGCSGQKHDSTTQETAVEIEGIAENTTESTAAEETESHTESEDDQFTQMTLEEKVAQMFIICPEAMFEEDAGIVTEAGDAMREAIVKVPVGGFIFMRDNLQSDEQTSVMLSNIQTYSQDRIGFPAFLSVDEEGGTVARIGGSGRFEVPVIEDMAEIGKSQDIERAHEVGDIIGEYLSELGFNLDFAPVADVLSNPENQVVKRRSFGADPELVSQMALAVRNGLESHNVYSVFKHFPGHGATIGDTHEGYAYTDKTLEELYSCELIPFEDAIEADASFIMAGHISAPQVTGDHIPASLSKVLITDILREEMGYDGIVITDALNMGAVTEQYTSSEAAIMAIEAGADILLMPENFYEAFYGVIEAIHLGRLTEERIDESVERILAVKKGIQSY